MARETRPDARLQHLEEPCYHVTVSDGRESPLMVAEPVEQLERARERVALAVELGVRFD